MANDRTTIGLRSANAASLGALVAAGMFEREIDAAKFALAHAVASGVPRGVSEGCDTKWNVGTADADGALKALVETLHPEETQPYRLVEHLMNEGLRLLDKGDALPPDVAGLLFAAAPGEG